MEKVLKIIILTIILACSIFMLTGCNQQIVDLNYTFDKAIVYIGNEKMEIEIEKWKDYEDGEQLQITSKDGTVYLVSSYNTILIKEK